MKRGKKYQEKVKLVDKSRMYSPEEAVELVKNTHYAKFDETVDIAIKLGVDSKKSDQQVRGTVSLPHGSGKTPRVLVFAAGEKYKEAETAGADYVGGQDMVEKINKGFLDFDKVIATPDMMPQVSKLGKILGPRGLMPNPKVGTVTQDVQRAVREIKAGRLEFKIDKSGVIHTIIGRVSFDAEKLSENLDALISAILRAKPQTAKGKYLKTISISASLGPGVKVNPQKFA